ncbi:hypothetical protein DXG01_007317 [Tephrocybe rancida]|nr:hypothetical protein DXG01_007317 [Tephrocybe rancida]
MWAYGHLPSRQILSELHWLTAFYVLSLVANAMSTGLLAYRIYTVRKESSRINPSTYTDAEGTRASREGHKSLRPILYIILESGALNAAYLFAYTMCLVTKTQGLEVMSEMTCPLTGIVFVIVIIRVGLYSQPDAYWPSPRSQTTANTTSTQMTAPVIFVHRPKQGTVNSDLMNTFGDVEDVAHGNDVELGTFRARENKFYSDNKEVSL